MFVDFTKPLLSSNKKRIRHRESRPVGTWRSIVTAVADTAWIATSLRSFP